jgi:hypothetical protein
MPVSPVSNIIRGRFLSGDVCLSMVVVLIAGLATADAADPLALTEALTTPKPLPLVAKPEPADLQAGWWRYFQVQGEQLDQRTAETSERLQTLLSSELPEDTAQQVRPLVERIRTNLQALHEWNKVSLSMS